MSTKESLIFSANQMNDADNRESLVGCPEWIRPIAPWMGLLCLGSEHQRRTDGGVYCLLRNATAEHRDLVGKTVVIKWLADWADESALLDFTLDKDAHRARMLGYQICNQIDGWKSVSPLESIVASTGSSGISVTFNPRQVTRIGGETIIEIDAPPIQIAGSHVALIQFVEGSNRGQSCTVRHWNAQSGDFDSELVSLRHAPIGRIAGVPFLKTSLDGIEHTPLNRHGWYAYGDWDPVRGFFLKAIEPRALIQVAPRLIECEEPDPGCDYASGKVWDLVDHKAVHIRSDKLVAQEGSRFLLMHSSWNARVKARYRLIEILWALRKIRPYGFLLMTLLQIDLGHLSIGRAECVRDPFTGSLKLSIYYKQTFFQNLLGNASLDQSWHVYAGSLVNGRAFTSSIADILIEESSMGVDLTTLEREIDRINYVMRLGCGHGFQPATPLFNCSMAVSYALVHAFMRRADEVDPDRISSLPWLEFIRRAFFDGGIPPAFWHRPFHFFAQGSVWRQILIALRLKVRTPVLFVDRLLDCLAESKAGFMILRSDGIGGLVRELIPDKPFGK
jgi:predicted Abi (CAAX) family protease